MPHALLLLCAAQFVELRPALRGSEWTAEAYTMYPCQRPLQALLRAGCCKLWIGKAGGLVAVDSVEKMHVVVEELLNERCFGMSTTLGSWQARHGRFAIASGLGRTNTE